MRFLILGASGFIGRHLRALVVHEQHCVAGTQSRSHKPDLLQFDLAHDRILEQVPASFLEENGPCHIVHCTGFGGPDQCVREVEASRFVNVVAIRRLIEDLSHFPVRHVYLSSSYVFDGQSGGYRESDPCHAICEYGQQKAQMESFLLTESPQSLILRLDKVVGDDPAERHLFSDWYEQLQHGRAIRCWIGQTMSPILVDDVGRMIVEACRRNLSGLFHVSGTDVVERLELARRFQQVTSLTGTIIEANQESLQFADPRPLRCHLDGRALRETTGFPATPLSEILAAFANRSRAARP